MFKISFLLEYIKSSENVIYYFITFKVDTQNFSFTRSQNSTENDERNYL
jgi:hypothetical protein